MDDVKMLPFEPFEGEFTKITLDKSIHITQLQAELSEEIGEEVQSVSIEEDGVETLYIHPEVDEEIVRRVLNSHKPEDNFGVSEEFQEFLSLKEKLSQGSTLTTKEISAVLRTLLHTS